MLPGVCVRPHKRHATLTDYRDKITILPTDNYEMNIADSYERNIVHKIDLHSR